MTFIASVIARDGVAIVADSLVSREITSMTESDFINLIEEKRKEAGDGNFTLTPDDLVPLFKSRTSFTRDFAEKLFQFDKWTCITTAGHAYINKKIIKDLIEEIVPRKRRAKTSSDINEILTSLCSHIEKNMREHVIEFDEIHDTVFIVSHYNTELKKGQIFTINVANMSREDLEKHGDKQIISFEESPFKVVCDGQDRISSTLLFGTLHKKYGYILFKLANKILDILEVKEEALRESTIKKIFENPRELVQDDVIKEFEILRLRELSLQEATDLACLLMAVVRDFQRYTEDTPTVGGQIKIAVIDKNKGFHYIDGDRIKPKAI